MSGPVKQEPAGESPRFSGTPPLQGREDVSYAVRSGVTPVQAGLVREAIPDAAGIVPGKPLVLVCTGAERGTLFPAVTGCRVAKP